MEIIHKDYCSRCKVKEEHMTPYSKTKRKGGGYHQYYYCHTCNNNRQRGYFKENSEKCREYLKKSTKKYQHKQNARMKVAYAIRTGRLIKPDRCEHCNQVPNKLEGAHHDYDKPLEVKWLCTPCHAVYDKSR